MMSHAKVISNQGWCRNIINNVNEYETFGWSNDDGIQEFS